MIPSLQHTLPWFQVYNILYHDSKFTTHFTRIPILWHNLPWFLSLLLSFFLSVILGKSHYLLYHLVAAMQPRMLVSFDEEMRPLPVAVRVGQVRVICSFFSRVVCPSFPIGCCGFFSLKLLDSKRKSQIHFYKCSCCSSIYSNSSVIPDTVTKILSPTLENWAEIADKFWLDINTLISIHLAIYAISYPKKKSCFMDNTPIRTLKYLMV